MEIEYSNEKVEEQCTSVKAAKKLFGGDAVLARSLFSRIQALESSDTLKDIVSQKQFRFHKLKNIGNKKLEGYFSVDVKSIREPWRIIIQPLNENGEPYMPCDIDKIAGVCRIVEVAEVSKHYE